MLEDESYSYVLEKDINLLKHIYADVILDFNGFLVSSAILTIILIIHHIRLYIKFKKQDI